MKLYGLSLESCNLKTDLHNIMRGLANSMQVKRSR